jgi:transcriptional regulator with XRE-family HTH domain
MKTLQKAFGNTLKNLRESAGLSQTDLGTKAGLDRTFISLLELGKRQPTITTIYKLAESLNVPVKEIIFRLDNQLGRNG